VTCQRGLDLLEKFGGAPVVGRIDLKRTADEAAEVPRVKGLGDTQCQI
jgi:hypothetical protein